MSQCRSCKHSSPQMDKKPVVKIYLTCGARKSQHYGDECPKVKCDEYEKAK